MQPIPSHIIDFLEQNHIVNFSAHDDDDFWAANCFYALDKANARLIIFTSKKTRHAQIMLNNPKIVGTICPQYLLLLNWKVCSSPQALTA